MMLTHAQAKQLYRLRWLAFIIVGLAYILSFFHRFAPAAIAMDLQQTFHASSAALGSLAATYFYVYTLMQIPTGVLADTFGARRLVVIGGIVSGVGAILFGAAETLAIASVGRLLVGLGVSVVFIALLKLNAAWFHDRHFATMTGLSILLGNVGSLLAATPLTWVLEFTSWRNVFVTVGVISLGLAGLAHRFVRNNPREVGLPSLREMDGKVAHAAHEGHWYEGLLIVVRNRATWPGLWINMGLAGSLFAFGGLWAVPFLREGYGMERAAATAHTSLLLAGFALGAFFIGSLSDWLGRRKPIMMAAAFSYCLCWLPWLFGWHPSNGISHLLFFVMGLGASSFTLTWSCAKEVNKHALSGMATSVVNTGGFLGTAIMQPLVGWVIEFRHPVVRSFVDYQMGIAILFVFSLIGWIATAFIRETYCQYVENTASESNQPKMPHHTHSGKR